MSHAARIALIEQRLQAAFAPDYLQVIDESEQHRGHAGAAGGAGHYRVVITAKQFLGLSALQVHRKIYTALQDLMPQAIHALRIQWLRESSVNRP